MRILYLLSGIIIGLSGTPAAFSSPYQSDSEESSDAADIPGSSTNNHSHGFANDDYGSMELSNRSARMLFVEAEQSMRSGDSTTAMRKVKRSMSIDNDDMDAHVLYAQLLEEKLRAQTVRDPTLYNQCVEEWLNIMRNKYGDEKGMRFRGINPCGDLFHDEERSITAKRALTKLTGFAPKTFETDNHYLKRVCMPYTDNVSGTVVVHSPKGQTH